jgi:uncharacterized protein YdgA (DUF945 family)
MLMNTRALVELIAVNIGLTMVSGLRAEQSAAQQQQQKQQQQVSTFTA